MGRRLDGRSARPYWTSEAILAALRDHAQREGEPPTSIEWGRAGERHPSAQTVAARFGSWAAGLEAAGLKPRSGQRGPGVGADKPRAFRLTAEDMALLDGQRRWGETRADVIRRALRALAGVDART